MTCAACGSANPADNRFCGACGVPLANACTACGAELQPDQRFCGRCGTPVATPGPAAGPATGRATAPASAPVAERRLVSVLFADLVGFTPFSEGRDAEEVRETLSRYFDIARDAIGRHGGTIEKFIGDAVMAVWGTPTAREDDAERAVRAALELLDAIHELGPGITARAGIVTGEAAVTLGATHEGMVAGDIVNTAARLQSVAPPGVVLVGDATHRAASAAIAFEPAGEHVLKGKEAPVTAWRALRVVAERGGRRRTEALEAPFTGRDEELRLLKDLFHATGREGRARLVSVTGPAGIGKSRLAWEFEKYLDGVVEDVWWHHGRSPAYSGGVTFWALGEMIRARCGLLESDDETHTRAKVAETLATHIPDPSERAWVEPAILQLLGVDVPPVSATELFARWRILFERLAQTGTVVLVFEDLHWADPGTLDFIDHLLEWSKAVPIVVLTLARPELVDARPDWGSGRRSFVAVAIDPLAERDMRTLLAGLVPGLPEPAVRGIVERAEGIPLYAVETVRMLVSEGRLVEGDGVYVPVGEIDRLAVPETLTALIAARLDALEPGDRTLVLDGAVLGQRFTPDALAAVAGMETSVLEPRLRGLVRREILALEADPRSPERGQYGFVQALIREVAYNTLARRDRKERHLAAARFFEQLGSDELAGALAGHYLSAHANAAEGPEADALAAQARVALRGAAERAGNLASYEQAAQLLRQALTVSTLPEDVADLEERLGSALAEAGHKVEATEAFERAASIQQERGDAAADARISRSLGAILNDSKETPRAAAVLEDAIARLAPLADAPAIAGLKGQLARAYHLQAGREHDAIRLADEVLPLAEHEDLWPILADTLITKGSTLNGLGRLHEGLAVLEAGERVAVEHGLMGTKLRGLNNRMIPLGDVDPQAAIETIVEGLALARRIGSMPWTRSFQGNLGWNGFRVGDWDLVEGELGPVVDEPLEAYEAILILGNLLVVRVLRGEDIGTLRETLARYAAALPAVVGGISVDEVDAWTAFAGGRFAEAGDGWEREARSGDNAVVYAYLAAALMATWTGDPDLAIERLDAFDATHIRLQGLLVTRSAVVAALGALDGRDTEAFEALVGARRTLGEMGLPEEAARVGMTAGIVLDVEDPAVAAEVRDAQAFWERVGATPLVILCDAILAGEHAAPRAGSERVSREPAPRSGSSPIGALGPSAAGE